MTPSQDLEERLGEIVDGFAALRVLVVGDLMLDDYRSGDVDRISPEAPVQVVRVRGERTDLGGAGNVARGLVALGARCSLVAAVGDDPEGERIIELLDGQRIATAGILRVAGRPTTHKMRVVVSGQQVLRVDREIDQPLSSEAATRLRSSIAKALPEVDLVILQDYEKGVLADGTAGWLIELCRREGKLAIADPKHDLGRFRGASLVKPNVGEACAFVPGAVDDFASRRAMLEKIQHELGGSEVVMTRGGEGMTALDAMAVATDIPTRAAEVFDVQGAGDTSAATLGLCRAAGASVVEACIVANAAAGIVVAKSGTAAVDVAELRRQLPGAIAAFVATDRDAVAGSVGRAGASEEGT